jgi:hypothetical protein
MAWPLRNSGIVLLAQDDARGAEPLLRQSLEILQRTRPAGYYQTAAVQLLLGDCLLRLGRKGEAATLLRDGVAILRAEFGAGDSRVVNGLRLLGQIDG